MDNTREEINKENELCKSELTKNKNYFGKTQNQFQTGIFLALALSLLTLPWWNSVGTYLAPFALAPLFVLWQMIYEQGKRFFLFNFVWLLAWNITTTYWVMYSTPLGFVAFISNAILMAITLQLARYITRKNKFSYSSFLYIALLGWISFEILHLNWDLSWPWITLGNAFATNTILVQWYEWTGILGGSIWIWLTSIQVYRSITQKSFHWKAIATLLIPIGISASLYLTNKHLESPEVNEEVIATQPNVNAWQKFTMESEALSFQRSLRLIQENLTSNTRLVITPETDITSYVNEEHILEDERIDTLIKLSQDYPNTLFMIGASSYKVLTPEEAILSRTKRQNRDGDYWEDYNSVMCIKNGKIINIHHKSKLVPGSEFIPFNLSAFAFFKEASESMGGTTGGITPSKNPIPSDKVTPAICYESIYGNFIRSMVKKGGSSIAILSNDGWWDGIYDEAQESYVHYDEDSPGYRQHRNYAKLRAIENRQWVFRSANTGISCAINPLGDITQELPYNTQGVIRTKASFASSRNTVYTAIGDTPFYLIPLILLGLLIRGGIISKKKLS